jgi:hypothetical protein
VANKGRRVAVAYSPYIDDIHITDTSSPNCGDPISNDVYLNAAGTAAQSTCRWRYFYTRQAVDWAPLHLSLT